MIEVITIGALELRFLHDKHSTNGALDMFELVVPAGARVPIPHYHESWEETAYGLEGEMTWTVAGQITITGPGQSLFIPRGAVHHFVNNGTTTARALSVLTPGVLGRDYFRELARLVAAGPPAAAEMAAVMRHHGLIPVPG